MGDTCSCLAVCFNFGLHVICLFQPVPDVGQQARTLAPRPLTRCLQKRVDFRLAQNLRQGPALFRAVQDLRRIVGPDALAQQKPKVLAQG